MSTSRLEKFVYAICSMDVSDLPVPLSRIEKLWNCLITGETPDFEPLSRNEKYLMAMLDRYDISNLPAPMSRGEKLLYKIAVGETDLSDVPGYLSRYEELLKYLIENGGISGGDFEYVLYTLNQSLSTLYNTAEKPVKSAILKGSTKYRDIDTGEVLDAFEEGRNLELVSVKMPVLTTCGVNVFFEDNTMEHGAWSTQGAAVASPSEIRCKNKHTPFPKGLKNGDKMYIVLSDTSINSDTNMHVYDENKTYLSPNNRGCAVSKFVNGVAVVSINDITKCSYFSFRAVSSNINCEFALMINDCVPYEPHKTNILSTSENVELRGIGDVRDELDLLTGEVTEHIGEIVLDGSENWNIWISDDSFVVFTLPKSFIDFGSYKNVICAKYPIKNTVYSEKEECIGINNDKTLHLQIRLLKTKATTTTNFKTWLSQNPITLQYILPTESVKTVDLTTVDQDNQPTQLGTFENVTHVSLESAGLIPEVEMEVATNLLEDTVFTLTDAFNTLYPTAAKPVVDGTLYGQTLVNLASKKTTTLAPSSNDIISNDLIKSKTTYTIAINVYTLNESSKIRIRNVLHDGSYSSSILDANIILGKNIFTVTTVDNAKKLILNYHNSFGTSEVVIDDIVIIEGNHANVDIPYFTGMQSVKMPVLMTTGKNLFHSDIQVFNLDNYIRTGNDIDTVCDTELKPSTTYTLSWNGNNMDGKISLYSNGIKTNYIDIGWYKSSVTFTTSEVEDGFSFYIKLSNDSNLTSDMSFNVQLEEGTTTTTYEPYKSNILTTPADLELRKVDKVQDEVNIMTGEVTERVKEITFNSSNGWGLNNATFESVYEFKYSLKENGVNTIVKSNNFIQGDNGNYERINVWNTVLYLCINKSKLSSHSLDALNEYFQVNPLVIQYQLTTPTTKTVDLTIVNQDGNETKLRTFDDTTHVLLNSEELVPTAALTVRTKIPSGSSTSLLMDDISTEQQQLETTVNEQSNNVDATMIATTEIYEETL